MPGYRRRHCQERIYITFINNSKCNYVVFNYVVFQGKSGFVDDSYDDVSNGDVEQQRFMGKPNLRMIFSRIREQVISEFSFFPISPCPI